MWKIAIKTKKDDKADYEITSTYCRQFNTKESAIAYLCRICDVLKEGIKDDKDKCKEFIFFVTEDSLYDANTDKLYDVVEYKTSKDEEELLKKGIVHFIDWIKTYNVEPDDEITAIDFIDALFSLANLSFSKNMLEKDKNLIKDINDIVEDALDSNFLSNDYKQGAVETDAWSDLYKIFYNLCNKEN